MGRHGSQQQELPFRTSYKWGGAREGAGRPKLERPKGLPHSTRPYHDRHHPVHVTWRVVAGLPSLRRKPLARAIGHTVRGINLRQLRERTSFRIVHFSIQPNHVHLIVEAGSKMTLGRGLRGLGIWLARRVNEVVGRRGKVLADRYHARDLMSPREVRNAIVYVLQNHLHHQPSA